MGCAPSGPQDAAQNLDERFAAPPPLAVNIGSGVRRGDGLQHHIIFIFGRNFSPDFSKFLPYGAFVCGQSRTVLGEKGRYVFHKTSR